VRINSVSKEQITSQILIVHNKYKIRGGEDSVVENEFQLLKKNECSVDTYFVDNHAIKGFFQKIITLLQTPFVWTNNQFIKKHLTKDSSSTVIHIHNYFPLLSPSIFRAIKKQKIATVHTLHNYRSICPTALLMHDGKLQERSVHHSSWWAVSKKVYRNSAIGTFALCCMIELHKKLGTWHKHVDVFIALTEFSRDKFIEAGWPAGKIYVKPNFIEDRFNGVIRIDKKGGYAVFVGRLSEEKDIATLLESWRYINYPLKVIGEGPLELLVNSCENSMIEYLGKLPVDKVLEYVQHAEFLILPSICYEGFPMVLVEAMCCGTPAIVSKLGSMEEIIDDGVNGLHFAAGDSYDLSKKVKHLIENKPLAQEMAFQARLEYLAKYTPEKNYQMLMKIYHRAIENSNSVD